MMKRTLFLLSAWILTGIISAQTVVDSVFMGPGYRNEVYYNLENGKRDTVFIKNWDLAFSAVGGREADFYSIFANHSNGVKVYKYPNGDVGSWATLDTAGWKNWMPNFNTDTSWNYGAFNRGVEKHPNYSWAFYTSSGELTGDSLWLLVLPGATPGSSEFFKFWPMERKSSSGTRTWKFRIARVDGSDDSTYSVDDKNFAGKNFSYVSIKSKQVINREPMTDQWHLVFTRYFGAQNDPQNPYYQVTGVLQNKGVKAIRISGKPRSQVTQGPKPEDTLWSRNISTIGYDWKSYDFGTNAWNLPDTLNYFVMTRKMDSSTMGKPPVLSLYKLFFTDFGGQANGKVVMGKELLTTINTSISTTSSSEILAQIYPNPASEIIVIQSNQMQGKLLRVWNMKGQIVHQHSTGNDMLPQMLDCSNWNKGMYVIELLNTQGKSQKTKILVQ